MDFRFRGANLCFTHPLDFLWGSGQGCWQIYWQASNRLVDKDVAVDCSGVKSRYGPIPTDPPLLGQLLIDFGDDENYVSYFDCFLKLSKISDFYHS